ncbi:MAG: hypothetical protein DRG78_24065 [Epsilonproteobacteria bacterium]|nr:MAG: hypothetical protein DRG78_24065 [Campylobacterota bacterium]
MFKKSTKNDNTNFWLSYADLMAGLLFVFILLIGAIITKSIVLKSNLDSKETSLESSIQALLLRDKEVQKLRQLLALRDVKLKDTQDSLTISIKKLELKTQEIINLNNILLSQNTKIDDFNAKTIILQNLVNKADETISSKNKKIQNYKDQVLILSNELTDKKDSLKLKDKKLLDLLQVLEQKETKYDRLITKLKSQKAKIKALTGIKIKVIAELKQSLGKHVEIDSKSGSLRLSSNILFDKGSSVLKESSKVELEKLFINYIGALISNKNIKHYLDRISIEGHTDSDGSYLYNLELSQKRAYSVMNYLLTLKFTKDNNIQTLLVASGRSYLDTIYKDSKEDKKASRRIEIKFTLKNDDAMNEIESILDYE